MGLDTYSTQWFYSTPDSQYRVSRSHPSSIPTLLGSHRVMNLAWCAIFAIAPESASWFNCSPEHNVDRLVHWLVPCSGSDQWSTWLDSVEVPLWVRWRCPCTPPQPCPSAVAVQRRPIWRSWPQSYYFLKGESQGKKISQSGKWFYYIAS